MQTAVANNLHLYFLYTIKCEGSPHVIPIPLIVPIVHVHIVRMTIPRVRLGILRRRPGNQAA